MEEIKLERQGEVDLMFNGDLLVDLSSYEPGKLRWTTIQIWRTDRGRYVARQIGKSTAAGEIDRTAVTVCDTPLEVRQSLQRRARRHMPPYLTDLALEALELAAEVDAEFIPIATERI
jgi:hypothetical protein